MALQSTCSAHAPGLDPLAQWHQPSQRTACSAASASQASTEPIQYVPNNAPSPHSFHMSRPGPKSRSGPLLAILIIQSISASKAVATDARVAGIVTRPAGAYHAKRITRSNQEAKHREHLELQRSDAPVSSQQYEHLTRTGERSFHRAVRRAAKLGTTTYRGRQHTLATLGAAPTTSEVPPCNSSHPQPRCLPSPSTDERCRIVTWNASGLTTSRLLEIETWLDDCQQGGSPVHLCILTETHWSFTSEWTLSSYHAVHSGLSNRRAGILALIHKHYMPGSAIRFSEPMPGRLLLLRLESVPATYVVCTYQHVWSESPSVEAGLTARESFWNCLASTIRGVPWRAQLVVTGDMNTPCTPLHPLVGPGITPLRGTARQKDAPFAFWSCGSQLVGETEAQSHLSI